MWLVDSFVTILVNQIEINILLNNVEKVNNGKSNIETKQEKYETVKTMKERVKACKIDCLRCIGDIPAAVG